MGDRWVALETVGMCFESFIQGGLSGPETRRYEAAVNVGGSEQGDAGVPVFVVVPMEESLAVGAGVFDGAESLGEVRAVFQGLELGLREGIVVGDVGAGMGSW